MEYTGKSNETCGGGWVDAIKENEKGYIIIINYIRLFCWGLSCICK